jgi:RNA polymerase sigma factor (sigma-70 family)
MQDKNRIYYIYVGWTKVEVPYEIYWTHHKTNEDAATSDKRYKRHNLSLDWFEDKGIQPKLANPEKELLDAMLRQERLDALHEALKSLTEDERQLVHFRYYLGKTQLEVAEMLGRNQSSISRREARILRKLRNLMEK